MPYHCVLDDYHSSSVTQTSPKEFVPSAGEFNPAESYICFRQLEMSKRDMPNCSLEFFYFAWYGLWLLFAHLYLS
jgi:hypothetical protein